MRTLDARLGCWLALGALGFSSAALAEEEWEEIVSGPITVKTRDREDSSVKEIWAEGAMHAPVQDVQAAMTDAENFPRYVPYVKESRLVGGRTPEGAHYVYTRLELPWVTSRDYVLKVIIEKSVDENGAGEFKNYWKAQADYLPKRANVVRLTENEGGWHITPLGDGQKSWAVYRFSVDPGGWIPSFAADLGNKRGVLETFKAFENEAIRRAAERKSKQSSKRAEAPKTDLEAMP